MFVWGVWAFLLAVALVFAVHYAADVPFIDDWAIIPYTTGNQPVTAAYLWEQHNEHRIPLPKLLLLLLNWAAAGDFRVGAYVNVALLAGLAAAMLVGVRRLRGRAIYTDALLPLLLLSVGHCENLLWTWQIQFTVSAVLIGALFLLIVGCRGRLPARCGVLIGLALLLLPLCGGQGLPYTVLLGAWLAGVGIRRLASSRPGEAAAGWCMLVPAVLALGLVGLYYVGYRKNPGDYAAALAPTLAGSVQTTLELWSMSLGLGVQHLYASNFTWPVAWILVSVMIAGAAAGLAISWYGRPDDRERVGGVVLFLLAVVGLSVAMGWARAAGEGHKEGHGFQPRYTTLMMPLTYTVYFACSFMRSPKWRGLAQMTLFSLACSLTVHNIDAAVEFGKRRAQAAEAFLTDLARGEPVYVLARRHARPLGFEIDQQLFADYLRLLHGAGIGPYRAVKADPPFREIGFPVQPLEAVGVTWNPPAGRVTDQEAYLTFALPEPRFVSGIRITISYPLQAEAAHRPSGSQSGPPGGALHGQPPWTRKEQLVTHQVPRLQVSWKTADQPDFVDVDWWASFLPRWDEERYLPAGPRKQTVIIWVGDTIDRFRIFPDRPLRTWGSSPENPGIPLHDVTKHHEFNISAIDLLVPEEG